MSARSKRAIVGTAGLVVCAVLAAIWFVRVPAGDDASATSGSERIAPRGVQDDLDAAGTDAKRNPAAEPTESVSSSVPGSSSTTTGEATLVVLVWDPPKGSEWEVSIDFVVQNRRGPTPRRSVTTSGAEPVRFEHVPVGPEVQVLARERRGRHPARRTRVDPALYACEVREVRLIQPVEPAVVFRVLVPGGEPLEQGWIHARLAHKLSSRVEGDMTTLQTDADGRARLVLAAPEGPANDRWLCVQARIAGERAGAGAGDTAQLGARVLVTSDLARRDTDVGDVRLEAVPIVASGVVRVPEGEELPRDLGVAAALRASTVEDSIVLDTHVERDGRFEVRGNVSGGVIGLRASTEGWSPEALLAGELVEVPVGARDVELWLVRGGSLHGSIIGTAGLSDPRSKPVYLSCIDAEGRAVATKHVDDGPYAFHRLPEGRYRVTVAADGETLIPLVSVDGVFVTGGAESRDPRLNIDLGARLRRLRLTLHDGEGRAVLEGAFQTLRGTLCLHRAEYRAGKIDIVVATEPIDVEIDAPGFETLRVSDVQDGQKIVLKRGRLLRLKMHSRELVDSLRMVCLLVRLVPVDGAGGRVDLVAALDEGGETSFTNVAPGKWRVELELDVDCDAPAPHVPIKTARETVISVGSQPVLDVALDVTEDEISIARARLPD